VRRGARSLATLDPFRSVVNHAGDRDAIARESARAQLSASNRGFLSSRPRAADLAPHLRGRKRSRLNWTADFCFVAAGSGLCNSTPPLKNAPSSIAMRWHTTLPVTVPVLRMSNWSLTVSFPLRLPSTTTSRACTSAVTWALRPIVTLLPSRIIEPSTAPSTYSGPEPATSPLITRDLPMIVRPSGS